MANWPAPGSVLLFVMAKLTGHRVDIGQSQRYQSSQGKQSEKREKRILKEGTRWTENVKGDTCFGSETKCQNQEIRHVGHHVGIDSVTGSGFCASIRDYLDPRTGLCQISQQVDWSDLPAVDESDLHVHVLWVKLQLTVPSLTITKKRKKKNTERKYI